MQGFPNNRIKLLTDCEEGERRSGGAAIIEHSIRCMVASGAGLSDSGAVAQQKGAQQQQQVAGRAPSEQAWEFPAPNCMRRLRAALGAAAQGGLSGPEPTESGAANQSGAASAETDEQANRESVPSSAHQTDEQEDERDELTSLPDTNSANKPDLMADNNGKQQQQSPENQDDGIECCDEPATCGYYSKQFNRLDPSRRSFSSPAVNLIQFGGLGGDKAEPAMVRQRDKGALKPATSYASKLASQQQKQRRRTALGLISSPFRLSTGATPAAHQKQASSSWRHWFSGGAARQEPRKSLLRSLRPQQKCAGKSQNSGRAYHYMSMR